MVILLLPVLGGFYRGMTLAAIARRFFTAE
jgi:hypothetical protein